MLELRKIKKDYKLKDQQPVHALKGISLNFRQNEFVAILGHSGCGKTTLLNITGGLDHYDSGDLIIKGKSTKDFKDNDWDTYRNHSVGFVFQSYNLIPHQTILKNVELALTISGIKKEERVERAKKALDMVGLRNLYKKKPNQLSGGQMQRVAIARALVNNPEIVLADEPTGALDSETSVQIMEILKKVADNHLVIMVTHNPELAEQYATRIVKMKDGEIYDDSDPYDGKDEVQELEEVNKGKKQSSMSFLTAFNLSLSNLFSKIKRTVLVALAGSIGIIGVSTILGVSFGVNNFIDDMQNDMLSSYPIGVAEESVDMTSLLTGLTTQDKKEIAKFDVKTQVGMDSMISFLLTKYSDFTNVKTNDITQTFVDYVDEMPTSYYAAINKNYAIDPTNNFFTRFNKLDYKVDPAVEKSEIISVNGLTQQYIKTLMTVDGFREYAQFVDLFTNFMKQLPAEQDYLLSQYDLLGESRFPQNENELLLVVDNEQTLTDLLLAQLGYYPQEEFLKIAKKSVALNKLKIEYEKSDPKWSEEYYEARRQEIINDPELQYDDKFDFTTLLNHEFYYLPHQELYTEGSTLVSHKQINLNMSGDIDGGGKYYLSLDYVAESDTLTGKAFEIIDDVAQMHTVLASRIGKRSTDPAISEIDGSWFFVYVDGVDAETLKLISDMRSMTMVEIAQVLSEHPEILNILRRATFTTTNATEIGERKYEFDEEATISSLMGMTYASITGKVDQLDPETPDYSYNAVIDPASYGDKIKPVKVVGILKPKPSTRFGTLSRGVYFTKALTEQYMDDAFNSEIFAEFVDHIEHFRYKESTFNVYVEFEYDDYSLEPKTGIVTVQESYASALNGDTSSTFASIFASFLTNGSDNLKTDKLHMRALAGMKVNDVVSDTDPSVIIEHTIDELPQSISFYPKNFNTKDKVTDYLKRWNSSDTLVIKGVDVPKEDRSEITYTDTISLIVEVISTLVTTVSIALIAFTSLSLVVSCFMIAVITYISVMERVKEIGVIRSLGGRKRDVSTLFISENLITGFSSGAIGIIFTYILQLIINAIVTPFGVSNICALPFTSALIMIAISITLSVISGLIPSLGASKQDPVVALRSE